MKSSPDLLVLHAVRLKGMGDERTIAARFALDLAVAREFLLDYQAYGWVTWSEFARTGGWSLTPAGRAENERRLAVERQEVGDAVLREVYQEFLPLNARLQQACTEWQSRPSPDDPMAFNDHTDPAWDARVVKTLTALSLRLDELVARLSGVLDRMGGYDQRFAGALGRVPRPHVGGRLGQGLVPHGLVRTARGPDRHPRGRARSVGWRGAFPTYVELDPRS